MKEHRILYMIDKDKQYQIDMKLLKMYHEDIVYIINIIKFLIDELESIKEVEGL